MHPTPRLLFTVASAAVAIGAATLTPAYATPNTPSTSPALNTPATVNTSHTFAESPLEPGSILLPTWAHTYNVTGAREVWIQPLYEKGDTRGEWDTAELLTNANTDLQWFTTASRGQFHITATRVLPPVYTEAGCNPLAETWANVKAQFLAANHPDTIHLVGASRERTCPWAGYGQMPGNTVIVSHLTTKPHINPATLIHELGHNLGLPHAAAYQGGALSVTRKPGTVSSNLIEYGDPSDPMGISQSMYSATAWNPANMAAIGWGQTVHHITGGTHTVTVPRVADDGPDGVVVDDAETGTRYVAYHHGHGVFLAQSRYNTPDPGRFTGRVVNSYLHAYINSSTYPLVAARDGTEWVLNGRIRILVTHTDTNTATIQVTVGKELTDTHGPAWVRDEPTLTWKRKTPLLAVSPAWDMSGVKRYQIKVGRGKWQTLKTRNTNTLGPVQYPITVSGKQTRVRVRLRVSDGVGNTTLWSRTVSRPAAVRNTTRAAR